MRPAALAALMAIFVGCSVSPAGEAPPVSPPPHGESETTPSPGSTTTIPATTTTIPATSTTVDPHARPDWLGARPLPLGPDGHGQVLETPPELVDRRLETIDWLPPPIDDRYAWSKGPVPAEVLARSSWEQGCPVRMDELAYLTLTHYGFDGRFHTGEMIVNAAVADDVIEVFRRLHDARFPIEQMRVIAAEEIDAPPTGDGNDTTAFVCRPAVDSSAWSQHAYGLAIDINPFHNPYMRGELVLPELASAYLDRDELRPGMIVEGDVVTVAFDEIGWGWGGRWSSLDDWMHFSRNGR